MRARASGAIILIGLFTAALALVIPVTTTATAGNPTLDLNLDFQTEPSVTFKTTFDTLQEGSGIGNASCSPTPVTSDVCLNVAVYQNNAPLGGDGSLAKPFRDLPLFLPPGVDVAYLKIGTGTTLNNSTGIILNIGQKLVGETIGYSDPCTTIVPTVSPARPAITNTISAAVTLLGDNEVAGVRIVSPFSGLGILATLANGSKIRDNRLEESGIALPQVTGEHLITCNDIAITGTTIGILVTDDGTPANFTVAQNTITGGEEEGIVLSSSLGGSGMTTVVNNAISGTDNEGIQIINRTGETTVRGNSISKGNDAAILLDEISGTALITENTLTDIENEGIRVTLLESQSATLTIMDNRLTNDSPEPLASANGIAIELRDRAQMTGSITNNVINRVGNSGINIFATDTTSIDMFVGSNTINDANVFGISFQTANVTVPSLTASANSVNRSGDDGIHVAIGGSGPAAFTVTLNTVTEAGESGIATLLSGDSELNLRIDGNDVQGSGGIGIDFFDNAALTPIVNASISSNESTSNAEEGIRVIVGNETDLHLQAIENRLGANNLNNADVTARDFDAIVAGALCIKLANNVSDDNYELEAQTDGIMTYEDVLGTNQGTAVPAVILTNNSGTLGSTAVGSCRQVGDPFPLF